MPELLRMYGWVRIEIELVTGELFNWKPNKNDNNECDTRATNNIAETKLNEAKETNYKPESNCTKQALQSIKKTPIEIIADKLSLKEHEWDW